MNTMFRNLGSERALRVVGQSSDLILALFIIVIIMMIIIPLPHNVLDCMIALTLRFHCSS